MTATADSSASDVARMDPGLAGMVAYSKLLATSNLLPAAFRDKPANVLWAVEYGRALGLSPMTALVGIHVIEGKPSASSALIGALVRRAGHRLRITGDAKTATATVWRADDPEFPFSFTFTWDDAVKAKLTGKSVWQQYPAAMLKARATTAVCRDACPEALYGLLYTPEELGAQVDPLSGDVISMAVEQVPAHVPAQAPPQPDTNTIPTGSGGNPATQAQTRAVYGMLKKIGMGDKPTALAWMSSELDREVTSTTDLTKADAHRLIEELQRLIDQADAQQVAAAVEILADPVAQEDVTVEEYPTLDVPPPDGWDNSAPAGVNGAYSA
jgi:hypothetical protein